MYKKILCPYLWPDHGCLSVHVFRPVRQARLSESRSRRHGQVVVVGFQSDGLR